MGSRDVTAKGENAFRRVAGIVGIPQDVVEEATRIARLGEVRGDTGLGLATDREEQAARAIRGLLPPEKES